MRFSKYWHRTQNPRGTVSAFGFSDLSEAEAREHAEARLERVLQALKTGRDLDRYSYTSDGLIREQVMEDLDLEGLGEAKVSRNSYGAIVLNSSNVMFVDVDVPIPKNSLMARLRKRTRSHDDALNEQLESIRTWQSANPEFSLRCYRTHSGFRLVVLNQTFDPSTPQSDEILNTLCNDPLYKLLCLKQGCFRARLTPKPWRIGLSGPPRTYPFQTEDEATEFRDWDSNYSYRCRQYRVCDPPLVFGNGETDPVVVTVLAYHDRWCLNEKSEKLA